MVDRHIIRPSAGRMRPNTSESGIFSTKRSRPVSTSMLTRMLVPKPKKAFQSPGVHRTGRVVGAVAACSAVMSDSPRNVLGTSSRNRGGDLGRSPAVRLNDLLAIDVPNTPAGAGPARRSPCGKNIAAALELSSGRAGITRWLSRKCRRWLHQSSTLRLFCSRGGAAGRFGQRKPVRAATTGWEAQTEPKMPPCALIILSPMSWNSGK